MSIFNLGAVYCPVMAFKTVRISLRGRTSAIPSDDIVFVKTKTGHVRVKIGVGALVKVSATVKKKCDLVYDEDTNKFGLIFGEKIDGLKLGFSKKDVLTNTNVTFKVAPEILDKIFPGDTRKTVAKHTSFTLDMASFKIIHDAPVATEAPVNQTASDPV